MDTFNIIPTASPTGTFVVPQSIPRTNAALELAESLGVVSGAVQSFVDQKRKKAESEGRRKGLLFSALTEKEAIEKGIITEFESPFFIQGQREQQGRLSGDTYDAALTNAYLSSGTKDNTNPAAYSKFAADFRDKYLNSLDPELSKDPNFLLGLGSKITQAEQQLAEQHVSNASRKLREDAVVGTQNEIYNEISKRLSEGPARPEDILGPVSLISARQKTFFLTGREVSAAKIDAIGQAAIDFNRPDLLDILDKPSADGTPGPGLTIEGRERISQIRRKILNDNIQREAREREENARFNKDETDKRMLASLRKISAGESVSEDEIREGERFDPDFRLRLISARKAISSDEAPQDAFVLKRAVNLGQLQTARDVYDFLETTDIQVNGDTVDQAIRSVEQVQRDVYSNPFVKAQSDVLTSTLNSTGFGGLLGDNSTAAEAKARFAERVVSEVSPAGVGSQEWRDQVRKIREEVQKESQESDKSTISLKADREKSAAKTVYFSSLSSLRDVSVLYTNGEKDSLRTILNKAGIPEDSESIKNFLSGQKSLIEQKDNR